MMNLWNRLLKKTQLSATHARPHMTWAHTSAGRTVFRTAVLLKKQIWIFPIIAILVLGGLAWFIHSSIERTMKERLRSEMQTVLNLEISMLEAWYKTQEISAGSLANDVHVREQTYKLLDGPDATGQATKDSSVQQQLAKNLSGKMKVHGFIGYFIADRSKRIISSATNELIGMTEVPEYDDFISKALDGKSTVSPPFASLMVLKDDQGKMRTSVPSMFVCVPIRDVNFHVVAVLALRIPPDREFTRLLQLGRSGESGETYAFDKSGMMVSNSRFDDSLIQMGILPDTPTAKSILNVSLRDPQVDTTLGLRPKLRRSEQPLTQMAADCVAGRAGQNVEGYRDYRGVPVVGVWKWLPDYNIGVATEIDASEAFHPLFILQWTFRFLFALLALSSLAIFIFSIIAARLRREAQKAAISSQKLGQYTLEKKLGSGGMGVVYLGHHAILRRATAIKMLNVDKVNDSSIERFEREVKITCQLCHPNTVAIYDYGRTEEGVFYYAMEYLNGIDLQVLVEKYGPQAESRIIRILTQACGSLYEAHTLGLVHRDIKPANLMLNRRGGEPDVVKVLDFGLVKALDDQKQSSLTAAGSLTGTPLYMSPEAIQMPNAVDARSDIYALGAVGYFLLTGQPVFEATNIVELCQQHVTTVPVLPSTRLGKPVSPELENVILACLEKSPARRPQTARDIAMMLERCASGRDWLIEEADAWWNHHERGEILSAQDASTTVTSGSSPVPAGSFDRTIVTNTD